MELLSVIRRWHFRDHFSIREISRRTGLSRNTVRKYLRSDSVEPKFNVPDRPSKLDPYADKLSHMLRQEAGKSRKQKRTIKQLHADLAALGYDGSYNRVAAFARDWRGRPAAGAEDHGPRRLRAPGVLDRRSVPVRLVGGLGDHRAASGPSCRSPTSSSATAAPSFSGPIRSRPTRCCSTPTITPSACWAAFPGAASTTTCEPPSTRSGAGRSGEVNARFSAMVSHFLFEAEFCNPASGWEKGQIEKNVQDARHRLWQPTPSFPSLAALNDWLETRCRELWAQTPHGSHPGSIADAWAEEARHLMPLPTAVRRLRRIRQARLADVPGPSGPQPLQRAGLLRQSPGQRAGLSRAHRRRRRGADRLRASPASSPAPTNARARRPSSTGGTIWRSFSASPEPCATARPSPNCRLPSGPCNSACSRRRAATARWSRSWRLSSSTTSRPCSRPSNWRWRPARRPRRIS